MREQAEVKTRLAVQISKHTMQGQGKRENQIQAGSPGTMKLTLRNKKLGTRKTLSMQYDTYKTQPWTKDHSGLRQVH